jgi:hypothetical protein
MSTDQTAKPGSLQPDCSAYPEHQKMRAIAHLHLSIAQAQGEFVDWLKNEHTQRSRGHILQFNICLACFIKAKIGRSARVFVRFARAGRRRDARATTTQGRRVR